MTSKRSQEPPLTDVLTVKCLEKTETRGEREAKMKSDGQDIFVCKQSSKVVSRQKKVEKRLREETSSGEMGERKYAIVLNQFLLF